VAKLALVVDDSMVIRKLVCQTLKGAGFETIEASNGRDGLALTAKHDSLALIITDQNMPQMAGIEFIQALRFNPHHKFTPVVFLTTETEDQIRLDARAAGATAWIVKPFHPDKILSVVKRIAV
jgi:two-component system, chemotaxis family, chemotaxis protein CheY